MPLRSSNFLSFSVSSLPPFSSSSLYILLDFLSCFPQTNLLKFGVCSLTLWELHLSLPSALRFFLWGYYELLELSEHMGKDSHLSGASWLAFPSVGVLVFHYHAVTFPVCPIIRGICSCRNKWSGGCRLSSMYLAMPNRCWDSHSQSLGFFTVVYMVFWEMFSSTYVIMCGCGYSYERMSREWG